jgi:hypothetical protein
MTLDNHQFDGCPGFKQKTMPTNEFENLMDEASYEKAGSGKSSKNGEGGIRTPVRLPLNRFRVCRIQPLCHLSTRHGLTDIVQG